MKILVACEESQAVTIEFRKLGHEAYSCDIQKCSGGHPEWHLQEDLLKILTPGKPHQWSTGSGYLTETEDGLEIVLPEKWDMIIGFPPCTFISNAGACRLYPTKGNLDKNRYEKGLKAKEFFMAILNANCDKIAIENPVSSKVFDMPKHSQEIQPFQFGHTFTKKTRLWLKGLPELNHTNVVQPTGPYIPSGTGRKDKTKYGAHRCGGSSKQRSKTFIGIAQAMADQWGGQR